MLFFTVICFGVYYMAQSFPEASWESPWEDMRAQSSSTVYVSQELTHGLNSLPVLVRVYVKPKYGSDQKFVLEGTGAPQRDDGKNNGDLAYGAVIYVYDENKIRVIVPKKKGGFGSTNKGTSICVGGIAYTDGNGWSKCGSISVSVKIKVKIWLEDRLPPADFNSSWLTIQSHAGNNSFQEIPHGLGVMPDFVNIQVRDPVTKYISEGIGASQNDKDPSDKSVFSGTVYAYSKDAVRLWTPHEGQYSSLFSSKNGWGGNELVFGQTAEVRILAWKKLGQLYMMKEVSKETDLVTGCLKDTFVSVKVKATDGPNEGFVFHGLGSTQNSGHANSKFGGVLFSYSDNEIRLFRPKHANGKLINIGRSWGNGLHTQHSDDGIIVVQAWRYDNASANCQGYIGTPDYDSGWLDTSSWTNDRKTLTHNLNTVPSLTKVLAKVTKGPNAGYVFEGTGYYQPPAAGQTSGGVFYYYDDREITLVLPGSRSDGSVGAVCVGEPGYFGGCNWTQCEANVEVKVQAWNAQASSNFQSLITMTSGQTFSETEHRATVTSATLVRVQMKILPPGVYVDGIGASNEWSSSDKTAGVLYAYNFSHVRVWLHGMVADSGSPCLNGTYNATDYVCMTKAEVIVSIWTDLAPPIFYLKSSHTSTQVINTSGPDITAQFVSAATQASSGENTGFIFGALGSAQIMGQSGNPHGGLLFGYSSSSIRLFVPLNTGRIIRISQNWGNGQKKQISAQADVIVTIWKFTSNSNNVTAWNSDLECSLPSTTTTASATTTILTTPPATATQAGPVTSQKATASTIVQAVTNSSTAAYPSFSTTDVISTTKKTSSKWFRYGHTDAEIDAWQNPMIIILTVSACALPVFIIVACILKSSIQTIKEKMKRKGNDVIEMKEIPAANITANNEDKSDVTRDRKSPSCRSNARSASPYSNNGFTPDDEQERGMTPFPVYIP